MKLRSLLKGAMLVTVSALLIAAVTMLGLFAFVYYNSNGGRDWSTPMSKLSDTLTWDGTAYSRALSFASADDLMDILGLIPGAVTPLGLLNDREGKVLFWLDHAFLGAPGLIGVHPNDNTATVWLKTEDLLRILRRHGTQITLFEV